MDINIIPVSGTSQPVTTATQKVSTQTTPATTSLPHIAAPAAVPVVSNDNNSNSADTQDQYEAAIRQASLSFKNVYAVSDSEFSIFKDASGKYITRYVSERDGKVTYVPEPTLIKMMQIEGGGNTARLSINA